MVLHYLLFKFKKWARAVLSVRSPPCAHTDNLCRELLKLFILFKFDRKQFSFF